MSILLAGDHRSLRNYALLAMYTATPTCRGGRHAVQLSYNNELHFMVDWPRHARRDNGAHQLSGCCTAATGASGRGRVLYANNLCLFLSRCQWLFLPFRE